MDIPAGDDQDQRLREIQRAYLDFLDDEVSSRKKVENMNDRSSLCIYRHLSCVYSKKTKKKVAILITLI